MPGWEASTPALAADSDPRPGDPAAPWEAGAYGLNVSGAVCLLGLSQHGAARVDGRPQVALELVEAISTQDEAQAVLAGAPGRLMIEALPSGGYRMSGPGVGRAEIEPKLASVEIEPPREDRWLWNRWVLGQVLPFLSALHGHELLHAGSVVVGEEAVAILGPSGRGKSTIVSALLGQGAAFLSDDVVALTPQPDAVLAHPGPGVVGAEPPRFHTAVGPRPLSTVCVLELGEVAVETMPEPDPIALLANVYERVRRDPDRLASQLWLLSDLADRSRFLRVRRAFDTDPGDLAHQLLEHLADL